MANKTFKAYVDKMGGIVATDYVGNEGDLFYDPDTTTLRISDGETPGGTVINSGGGSGGGTAIEIRDGLGYVGMDGDSDLYVTNTDDDIIISTREGGDDINLWAGDSIRIDGGNKQFDAQSTGGTVRVQGGDGSGGDALDAGNGGSVTIRGGQGGVSNSEVSGQGGTVFVYGGYTARPTYAGGDVQIYGGYSVDATYGNVQIGNNNQWLFDENKKTVKCPSGLLTELGDPTLVPGARSMITDSNLTAAGNFGEIAVGGGSNIVPVYSDGTDWRIG